MDEETTGAPDLPVASKPEHNELAELIAKGINQVREPVELYTALAEAKKAFKAITRDREVQVRKKESNVLLYTYKYATLGNILDAITIPLAEQGLSLIQRVVHPNGADYDYVETRLAHKSGQTIHNLTRMIQTDEGQVGFAKAQTYARRYGVSLLLCLAAEEDDDSNQEDEVAEARDIPSSARLGSENDPTVEVDPPVDVELMDDYAKRILQAFDNQDPGGAKLLWNELTQAEQTFLWKQGGFTQKQKDKLRPTVPDKTPRGPRGRA